MLSCPLHQHSHSLLLHHRPNTTISSSLRRTQNSKSTSLLLRHLSQPQPQPQPQDHAAPAPAPAPLDEKEKVELLELSLVTKRTPQFPGSIYVQSPSDPDVHTSLPPLQTLFQTHTNDSDEEDEEDHDLIMRALEIRRKVTAEIFKESMIRKGKFGITYATNLTRRLSDFIDYVMVEAAAMKRLPDFSESTFNFRAKTVIDDSRVVPLIRWLKHNSVSYPKIGKLICMSRGKIESIRRVIEWLKSIHVKGEFLGVALTKSGGNILDRSNEELDEIVNYLESNGVRMDWMGYVVGRCPQLLSYNMEEVRARVGFFLDMGMNEKDFGTMVFDYPRVLGYFTLEEMNEKVSYLKEFGIGTEEVGKLIAFKPQLMGCSIEEKLKPLVKYLYYHGISRDGMKRILMSKPIVFCIDLETTIVPKVRFLQDIGIRDDAIGNMLVKFPSLLTCCLYKKIRPVVIFLMTRAGVNEKDIGKVIALGPELLGCSISKKLEVSVTYFMSLGIRYRQLGGMIADFPMLLRYNVDVLRPKYRYLRRTMVRPLEDLIEFPRFFSYSLDDRIIPRHKILVEKQINLKLRYMLACTDEEFDKKVEAIVKRRQRFEAGLLVDTLSETGLLEEDLSDSRATDDPVESTKLSESESI
ncbi:transcription termination factor MTERF2, chloroplastic [Quercus robur]|uniref:transcription termination factor MTERF2, chloroplastic n=1 Tax=Quercus robur TaxID=38942 RepID=UPI002163DA93|nr:transcription termination factor MTERF2, chloroplastic [Quercus robur]